MLIYESDFAPLVEQLRASLPRGRSAGSKPATRTKNCSRAAASRGPTSSPSTKREIAELFYTSGSTGTPKGVTLSHRTLYLHMLGVSATFYNDETMVELHTIPLFHANGWGRPQCATFHGLKQVMVRRFDPAHVLRLIQEEQRDLACRWCPPWPTRCSIARSSASSISPACARFILGGAASSPGTDRAHGEGVSTAR